MEEIRKIRSQISAKSLSISRIPPKVLERFYDISEDFCADYGMTLKFLIDFYDGIIVSGVDELAEEIASLKARMSVLEEEKNKPKKKVMLDGTKR